MVNKPELTYDNIQIEAERFAAEYRQANDVPVLPGTQELNLYKGILEGEYSRVIALVQQHVIQFESVGGHEYEHLEYVATMAGYIAADECQLRNIPSHKTEEIIETAILCGLLHDIERHRGYGEDHMIEGEVTARRILEQGGINLEIVEVVASVVRSHDYINNYQPQNGEVLEICFGAVFDADHFRYGLEREDTFWGMKEKSGKLPNEVIHDYQFLPQFRNAWRTRYGKEVGPKFIDFGLAVAKHIEEQFS